MQRLSNIPNNIKLKHWTIWDELTDSAIDLTHEEFKEGINNKSIKLKGFFKEVENNKKIWIDGIIKT